MTQEIIESPNVPLKRLTAKLRLPKLIEGMKQGLTFDKIAVQCGVSEKTIDRDFAEWKDNGGFDKWLLSEFIRLHDKELSKEEGGDTYKVTADLLKKRLKETSEVTVQGKLDISKQLELIVKISREDDEEK